LERGCGQVQKIVVGRGSIKPARQHASGILVAEDRAATVGMAHRARHLEHPEKALTIPRRERSPCQLRHVPGNQEHLQGKPVVGQRGFEPDTVGQDLAADLAFQCPAGESLPT